MWRSLAEVPRERTLFVSFSNGHYSDMMLNWAAHLKRMQARAALQGLVVRNYTLKYMSNMFICRASGF